ncbi:SMP-30/gluconolactonase/LRE family protein [Cesiribacter sp. SM1]|uniref:SMP-30/gluconolactonase/LRE family protein n=1 Tax=Cesiribacter sp. SM1 TaxID=2861196 RepID=UPI001CD47239|nr:SMP-30/gluconolactonase/LRE family protein [Cesiribacter sp. SM1]
MSLSVENVSIFADGLDHPECIAVHPNGSVWAGGEAGQVYRISADGRQVEEVSNTGGFILGIAFSPDASWLALCDLKHKCLWKLELESLQLTKFATGADGVNFNIPNYPVFDSQGNLYVSESGAFREVSGKVFKFDTAGEGRVWHNGPFNFANGMALSADEKHLYIVCTWLPGVERVAIREDGSAGSREVYTTLPQTCPDGVAFDAAGNLYISCYAPNRIYKVSPKQEVSLLLDDWEGHTLANPTNIAFGGEGYSHMFIASLGRWHIGKIAMDEPGLALAVYRSQAGA